MNWNLPLLELQDPMIMLVIAPKIRIMYQNEESEILIFFILINFCTPMWKFVNDLG